MEVATNANNNDDFVDPERFDNVTRLTKICRAIAASKPDGTLYQYYCDVCDYFLKSEGIFDKICTHCGVKMDILGKV